MKKRSVEFLTYVILVVIEWWHGNRAAFILEFNDIETMIRSKTNEIIVLLLS
jgi:hypothetical protein